jgi:hypothetical protein
MDHRPRLSVELTTDQYKKLGKLVPWGQQRILFSKIVDELISLLEEHGSLAIGAILSNRCSFLNMVEAREEKKHV